MSTKPQIELFLENESGTQQVAYPFVESDHVSLSNGMDIDTMIRQDVSMPTVAHEDLSFKAGVGDQDVSSAIVDSSVAEMTIKGKTYQNILPEPSTHVLTNNKEMFKVNEGLDPNVEIVDGVSKSAILSGQTKYMYQGVVQDTFVHIVKFVSGQYLDPKTGQLMDGQGTHVNCDQYFKIPSGATTIVSKGNNTYKKLCLYDSDKNYIVGDGKADGGDSTSDIVRQIPSNARYFRFSTSRDKTKDERCYIYIDGVLVATSDVDIECGLTSCKMPVLKTTGKNLCDTSKYIHGGLSNNNMIFSKNKYRSYYMKCKPSTVYTVKVENSNNRFGVGSSHLFSEDTAFTLNKYWTTPSSDVTGQTLQYTVTTTEKDEYLYVYVANNGVFNPDSRVQVEEGSVATAYEPYKSNILSTGISLTKDMIEQGTYNGGSTTNTYEETKGASTTRLRTKSLIEVKPNTRYRIKTTSDFQFNTRQYSANGITNGATTGFSTDITITTASTTKYMTLLIKDLHNDSKTLTVDSFENGCITISTNEKEVVLRSLPNGVCDTLNLNTGEYVQRIGEVVLDGSESWAINNGGTLTNTLWFATDKFDTIKKVGTVVNTDKLSYNHNLWNEDKEGIKVEGSAQQVRIRILKSKLTTQDINGFKQYLSQNPLTVQYQLTTESVKTVDLSTSGNWEKIVLDGSEDWRGETIKNGMRSAYILPRTQQLAGGGIFSDKLKSTTQGDEVGIRNSRNNGIYLQISDNGTTIKQWVTANAPLTVWYQTITTQDSTQVKQPIFFKDGHIIQSSGADNSLIPTLDYQAKTSNSYVMDLMKANTRYTMKAKSASGTFTIDGTSYGAGTNGTFTTPSSMTNKFLVMSNKTNEEVMILEGDVTSKTIPYFKGIKSAFEGEDKIEVLSTGKNLFDRKLSEYDYIGNYDKNEVIIGDNFIEWNASSTYKGAAYYHLYVKPNTSYTLSLERNIMQRNCITIYDGFVTSNMNNIGDMGANKNNTSFVTLSNKITIRFSNGTILNETFKIYNVQLEEGDTVTTYEPYKSNSTKIPLLSSLRSLPNGVCDEIILDRENNKAKIIQRVGEIVFDGSEDEGWAIASTAMSPFAWALVRPKPKNSIAVCDKMAYATIGTNDYIGVCIVNPDTDGIIRVRTPEIKIGTTLNNWQEYLRFNPMKVQYELGTPIITEVDLEGFPYIYKDGHIFLNGEIAPVTEIKYSINQQHQIEASNQDIIRHQKEIDYLYKLIGEYVRVDYKNTLLSLNLELK